MKSEKRELKVNGLTFPLLMKNEKYGFIILATGINDEYVIGTLVSCDTDLYDIGHYNTIWSKSKLKVYGGEVLLSND